MQFEKFHGIALVALGALLLLVQASMLFHNITARGSLASQRSSDPVNSKTLNKEQEVSFLPGGLGLFSIVLGSGLLVLRQRRQGRRTAFPARRMVIQP
jgi:hypothetical protein